MHGWSTAAVLVSALCSAALLLDLLLLDGARTVLTFVACAQVDISAIYSYDLGDIFS